MATTGTAGQIGTASGVVQRGLQGAAGGVAGGLVFGLLMQVLGMLPMVAMLVGSESVSVGWVVHLAISAFLGALFGVLVRVSSFAPGVLAGLAYGALWWVLGPLLLMPAQLGMPLFTVGTGAVQSLIGHLLFGAVLGLVVAGLRRRA